MLAIRSLTGPLNATGKAYSAGNTLFHGYCRHIAHQFAPFDVAFLPINGQVVEFPFLQPPSPREAMMTLGEAAIASNILLTKSVVPIYYGALHKPPLYIETPNATGQLRKKLKALDIKTIIKEPGSGFELNC